MRSGASRSLASAARPPLVGRACVSCSSSPVNHFPCSPKSLPPTTAAAGRRDRGCIIAPVHDAPRSRRPPRPLRDRRAARRRGAWARSTARATRGSTATWRSRCCRSASREDADALARFEREAQARSPRSRTRTSSRSTTSARDDRHAPTPSRSCSRARRCASGSAAAPLPLRKAVEYARADRARPRRRARQGHRPPRPQAGEPVRDARRAASRSSTSAWLPHAAAADGGRRQLARRSAATTDPGRRPGHGRLHVARAGARRSASTRAPTSSRSAPCSTRC